MVINLIFQSAKAFDESGSTAVHKASASGHLEVLKLLIQHGGDIELADMSGCTPLHVAARNGHLTCVKYLILQGADFRVKSKKGNTAMAMAKANCQPKVADYLSNCGKLKPFVTSALASLQNSSRDIYLITVLGTPVGGGGGGGRCFHKP